MSVAAAIPHTPPLVEPEHSKNARPVADVKPATMTLTDNYTNDTVDAIREQHEVDAVMNFLDCCALQVKHDVDAYLADLEAQRVAAEEAARVAAAQAARRATTTVTRGGTTVGECTGFAIPDYIIQRESGGNPSAMNPSGAYGCAQTLLSHYYGGSCSGLDPYTIDGQRQCVDILSNGGTNLSPWTQTR